MGEGLWVTSHSGQPSFLPSEVQKMSIGQRVLCGRKGNRGSSIALVMHYILGGISTYGSMAQGRGMSSLSTLIQGYGTILP